MRYTRYLVLLSSAGCVAVALMGCSTGSSDAPPASPASSDSRAPSEENGVASEGADAAGVANLQANTEEAVDMVPLELAGPQGTPGEAAAELDVEIPTSLQIGDTAPKFYVDKWMTGVPAEGFEEGKVHVVEFWATWCPPCRASMPHISQLQDEYGDQVKFIGFTREDEATVTGFLDKPFNEQEEATWREIVTYSLVLDKQDITSQSYMTAAKQRGIPTAFIVGREGHIEWIGHPMQMDEPLEQVVAGTWDRVAALAEMQRRQEVEAAMAEANASLREALTAEKWDEALAVIDGLLEKFPDQEQIRMLKFQVLLNAERASEANVLAGEIAEAHWDDAAFLNQLSWMMATQIPPEVRDLPAALKYASRADEIAGGKDGSVADTIARIHHEMGDLEQAIVWQQKAVDASPEPELQRTLQKYLDEKSGGGEVEESAEESGGAVEGEPVPEEPETEEPETEEPVEEPPVSSDDPALEGARP